MRATASILLFSLVILVTETASVIPLVKEICHVAAEEKSLCGNTQRQSSCGVPDADSPCSKKKKCEKKESNDNCKENEKCNSCPICYVFIFQPGYELQVRYFSLENKYPLPEVNDLPSYSARVWKPPNQC